MTQNRLAPSQDTEHRAESHTEPAPVTPSQDESSTGQVSASLSSLVTCQLSAPGLSTEKITALVDEVEQQLTALVPDCQVRQSIYTAAASSIVTYIDAGAELTSIEALASLTRRTRARIVSAGKKNRSACVRSLISLVTSLDKPHKLNIPPYEKEAAKQAIERQLDALASYLLNRLADENESQDESSTEPINMHIRRKAAALREYGYVLNEDGLYSIRLMEDEEILTLISKLYMDVSTKRHIYSVPEYITERPKEQGVVLVTQIAPIHNRKAGQTLEIHRSDMLARQPKFLEQIQVVVPPHKKKLNDFIHALEAMGMAAPVENRYNSTGLVRPGADTFVFLHAAGGGITERGLDERYHVQFPLNVASRLTSIKYGWQRASLPSECVEDYQVLLQVLGIAPGSTGYGDVLLGIHGFTPMSQLCSTGGIWAIIHGLTGSKKSASSRLPLQGYAHGFYGRQETSTINLREGASTPYAIEQVLYYLAGMFAHLDDGLKGNNVPPKEVEKFYKLLSTIGGHAVTKQGGKRGIWGQGEGGFGIEPYPRGSGVYTVETLPASEEHASDLARYIVVALDGAECVDTDLLDTLQSKDAAASMNRATCSYIQWLLPCMDELLEGIAAREEIYREQGVHTRTPTSYAKLETGIAALLQYGVSIGAHTEQDAARMLAESRARLVTVALQQKALMGIDEQTASANDSVHIFYELLRQALRDHKMYVSDPAYKLINTYENGSIVSSKARPQPPLCLDDEQQEVTHERADSYGWRWDDKTGEYILAPEAQEAGVLKMEGVRLSLWMYASDFKGFIYRKLDELRKEGTPLPGLNEMTSKLKARGKLTSTNPTNLHGRGSQTGRCYVLDMTPDPESIDDLATDTNEDGTLNFDLDGF